MTTLDEQHMKANVPDEDENFYSYGSINGHNTVIACLPAGMPRAVSAASVIGSMKRTFPNNRMQLLVGIGGGVPRHPTPQSPEEDIFLGDEVVGWPKIPELRRSYSTTWEYRWQAERKRPSAS